jgi:hypothetical protein
VSQFFCIVLSCLNTGLTMIRSPIQVAVPKCVKGFIVSDVHFESVSSVGMAVGYGLDNWGSRIRFPAGTGNFSLYHRVHNGSGAHQASYPMGIGALSLGVKRPGREADHSPPSNAEVKE